MILYTLQVHHRPEQIPALVELLNAAGNAFIINVDPQSSIDRDTLAARLKELGVRRFIVRRGTPVTWAGISQVHGWIDVFEFALRWDQEWKYLINLSGECVPLVPQSSVLSFLEEHSRNGRRAHMWFYTPKLPHDNYHLTSCGEADAADLATNKVTFAERVAALIQADILPLFTDRKTDPIWQWELRGAVHVTDLVLEKKLVFRKLYPFEAAQRRRQTARIPLAGGRAWYLLRRDAVEDIMSDPLLPDVVALLEHYLSSDELFMQTLIRNSAKFKPEQIGQMNAHFKQGDPIWVADSMADQLFSSDAFFVRKVGFERCSAIVARVREIIASDRAARTAIV
jgi:hypothetical protein